MRYMPVYVSLIFISLASVFGYLTYIDPYVPLADMTSPKRITYIFIFLLIFWSLIVIFSSIKEIKSRKIKVEFQWRLAAFAVAVFLYVLLLTKIGYYPILTPIFLFIFLLILKIRLPVAFIIALLFSNSIYLIFHTVLGVPLP